ncbi:uncharacterized protein Nmag_3892 (plasmid) [Natrialba magadii ATCC 43099]|uniref:Uncharacterized protein n=1 Tax=Natrialba magadii (strain ATCC 43099 / DSM 3394 / CCM 3739 / CIP 104546 / IAM 13178 / JCM 8861 / NBRC 102185 / NCIMB 2190 / MS3) TaxID=547559 RepID=D3T1H4_NATMM|nr:hypothetical protein [Natrialba magadii]ADD07433.1 uncharacterized protein Nmag_3892 [Natrialba magadii ATCC 43099]ELY32241.1 hypothetical protein C500_04164 [Natrialba magadii ATCC 43099]
MGETPSLARNGSLAVGAGLLVLGGGAYVGSSFESVTALIPALFGLLVIGLRLGGDAIGRDRLATYGIGALAVAGILGSARGVSDLIALLTGGAVDSTIATVSQGLMIALCLVLLGIVVQAIRTAEA